MRARAVTRSSRIYIGRLLAAEASAAFVLLGLIGRAHPVGIGLIAVGLLGFVAAAGRPLGTSTATLLAWCLRRRAPKPGRIRVDDDVLIDPDGIVVIFELAPATGIVVSGVLRLPDTDTWGPLGRNGPSVQTQILIRATPTGARAFLAIRVVAGEAPWHDQAIRAKVSVASGRATRRLDRAGIQHVRLAGPDLMAVAESSATPREAWDHLRMGRSLQITVEMPLGAAGMTSELLHALTDLGNVRTNLTWAGTVATVRVDASDRGALSAALATLGTIGPIRRLDGRQAYGRALTSPLALDPVPAIGRRHLSLARVGVKIGSDREGNDLYLRIPARRAAPVAIIVIGGPAAARSLVDSAGAAGVQLGEFDEGVPLRMHVLDRPHPADGAALRAADLVICQPLAAPAAIVVAAALGLSAQTATWLARIESGMVAVIADGQVRWAMLPARREGVSAGRRS